MGSRQKATWSQKHGGMIAFFVIAAVICCVFPLLFLLVIPLGLFLASVTLAGYVHARMGMHTTINVNPSPKPTVIVTVTVCGWCGIPEPKKPIGWHLVSGVPKCPNCP